MPESQRKLAAAGDVEVGFDEFAVFMAWGPPADTVTRDPDGRPVRLHTFIRCTSGPRAGQVRNSRMVATGKPEPPTVVTP